MNWGVSSANTEDLQSHPLKKIRIPESSVATRTPSMVMEIRYPGIRAGQISLPRAMVFLSGGDDG
jgi:hypothetical protein